MYNYAELNVTRNYFCVWTNIVGDNDSNCIFYKSWSLLLRISGQSQTSKFHVFGEVRKIQNFKYLKLLEQKSVMGNLDVIYSCVQGDTKKGNFNH